MGRRRRRFPGASGTLAALVLSAAALGAACGNEEERTPPVVVKSAAGPLPPAAPAESHLLRLTAAQYRNTIRDLFGDSVVVPPRLEPDGEVLGMVAIGASRTSVSARGTDLYEEAAYKIAAQAMAPGAVRERLVRCAPAGAVDEGCARAAISALARRAFRRPPREDELARLVAVATDAARALGDFYDGLEFAVAAILQAPSFLFRAELGEPDPDAPGRLRYSSHEMASRLSFFLWNTTPDDELLSAADAGALTTDDGLRAQAARLLASPRAREAVRAFFGDLFGLRKLDALVKDTTVHVHMSAEVGPSAREETLRTIEDHVFERDGDYRDLLTSRRTFLNRKLASLYEVRAPAKDGFGPVEWPEGSPRAGLLGHASLLALHAHPVVSSATLRGRFVREVLLCAVMPPPPVDVNTALPEPSGTTRTLRERIAEHLSNTACAACHLRMDPIGLGLENFDALGRFRTKDNGAAIDASGDLDGVPFRDVRELARALRDHPDLGPCLVRNLHRYATGHPDQPGEQAALAALADRFRDGGYRVRALLAEVVMSESFRKATIPTGIEGAP